MEIKHCECCGKVIQKGYHGTVVMIGKRAFIVCNECQRLTRDEREQVYNERTKGKDNVQ